LPLADIKSEVSERRELKLRLSFLLKFCFISLASVLLVGLVLGWLISSYMTKVVIHQAISNASFLSRSQLDHHFTAQELEKGLTSQKLKEIDRIFQNRAANDHVILIKIWNRKGTIAYSTKKELVNQKFSLSEGLKEVFKNKISAEISESTEHRDSPSQAKKLNRVIEVYTPIHSESSKKIIGSYEIYFSAENLVKDLNEVKRLLWLVLFGGLSFLYLFLFAYVKGTSRALVEKKELEEVNLQLNQSLIELEETYLGTIETLSATVDAKDNYTAGHSVRVSCFASILGRLCGLSDDQLERLEQAALFHDIGKIATPECILNKRGKLEPDEFEKIKKHPEWGEKIIQSIPFLRDRAKIIRQHHENYDGSGYPDGLKGKEISLEARILRIVDAYDALTSHRPYRGAKLLEETLPLLIKYKGTQFDPRLVDLFVTWLRENQPASLDRLALML